MLELSASVDRSIALWETNVQLRRDAAILRRQAIGVRAQAALARRRTRVRWILGASDGSLPATPEPTPDCHLCAEAIDPVDPIVTHDNGEPVHVRCWRLPDPVRAPLPPFAESPMPPIEAFRSRPGRPPRDQAYGPKPKLR
jgi:hypothetical protein